MGKVKREWQDTDYVLSYFGQKCCRRRNYQRYVQKGAALGRRPELGKFRGKFRDILKFCSSVINESVFFSFTNKLENSPILQLVGDLFSRTMLMSGPSRETVS
jgi:hypothetical protein